MEVSVTYGLRAESVRSVFARAGRTVLFGVLALLIPNCGALTGSLSPSNPTVGVTNVHLVGTATPGSTVTVNETAPDLTAAVFTQTANSSGNFDFGPYMLQ